MRGALTAIVLSLAGLALTASPLVRHGAGDEPLQEAIRLSARASGVLMLALFAGTGRHGRLPWLGRSAAALAVAFAVCHLTHLGLLVTRLVRFPEPFLAVLQVVPSFLGGMVYALVPWVGWRGLRALGDGRLAAEGFLAVALHILFGAILLGFATRASTSGVHLGLTLLGAAAALAHHLPTRGASR